MSLSELEEDEDDEEGVLGTGIICGAVACRFVEVVVCGCMRLLEDCVVLGVFVGCVNGAIDCGGACGCKLGVDSGVGSALGSSSDGCGDDCNGCCDASVSWVNGRRSSAIEGVPCCGDA